MEIASAFVSVMPSMRGFRRAVTSEAEQSGDAASRSFGRRFGSRVGSEGKRLGSAFGKAFAIGATVAVGAGLGFAKAAISEAADLEQSVGAIQTVFKRSSAQMLTWSKQAARAVGLSKNEFNELGTLIGSQLKNGGTAMDQLAPKTNKLIGLGADLSSMFGGTTREAVEALSSALKGERDPIERYGVTLNQAKIDAEAAALGFKKVGKTYDTNAQQAATLSLIYKQTADAQGNFARETDTTAHKQQVLAARFDNLKARIGKGLLPVYNTLLDFTEKRMGPAFRSVTKAVRPVITAIGDRLGPAIERVTGFMRDNPAVVKAFAITLGILAGAIGLVTLATTAFSIALNSTGIPLVIIGIAALVAGLVYAYQRSEQFRAIVDKIGQILRTFGAFVRDEIVPVIIDLAQKVGQHLQPVWVSLVGFFTGSVLPVTQQVLAKFREWQPTIQRVIAVIAGLVAKWLAFYAMVYGKVLPVVLKVAGFLLKHLVPAILLHIANMARAVGAIVAFARALFNAGKAVGDFAKKVANTIGDVVKWFTNLPGRITSAIGDFGTLLENAGGELIRGLVRGFTVAWDKAKGVVEGVAGWIKDRFPGSPVKKGPLRAWNNGAAGKKLMGFLAKGIKDGARGVLKATDSVAEAIDKALGKKKGGIGKKLAKTVSGITRRIAETAQALNDAITARNDAAASVASGFMGEFNLSEIFGKNEFGLSLGASSAVKVAQSIVARLRAFAGQLTQLIAAGMPGPLVQEVAGLGSIEGKRVADVLLQGGGGAMAQISGAYNDFKAIAHSAGMDVANANLGADIATIQAALEAALERGLAKLGVHIDATIGVTNDAAVEIVNKGEKRKKKRR